MSAEVHILAQVNDAYTPLARTTAVPTDTVAIWADVSLSRAIPETTTCPAATISLANVPVKPAPTGRCVPLADNDNDNGGLNEMDRVTDRHEDWWCVFHHIQK